MCPHEALEMHTPAEVYEPSEKTFPACVSAPDYPDSIVVRSVRRRGHFCWKKHEVFLSEVFCGQRIGLSAGSQSSSRHIPSPVLTARNRE